MPKFRSRPVEIEAWQWDGGAKPGVCICKGIVPHLHTMHNDQIVVLEIGDWIVPESIIDRYYPIKPDVFAKKYEEVV